MPTTILFGIRHAGWGRRISVSVVAALVAACAVGQRSEGFVDPALGEIYIPLSRNDYVVLARRGAAIVVAPHVAATNAHNSELVPREDILAQSRDYDLLFFRTDHSAAPPTARAQIGQRVITYGQGNDGDLREASGVIRSLKEPVVARCEACQVQGAITFDADAGPGFSGGPVVDANTGAVVGIVFGFSDDSGASSSRLMYAYDMELVTAEMNRLLAGERR